MACVDRKGLEAACLAVPLYLRADPDTKANIRSKMEAVIAAYLDATAPTGAAHEADLKWLEGQRRHSNDPFEDRRQFEERQRHNEEIDRLIGLLGLEAPSNRRSALG